jgi:tetratricopeptide (TPR) repeat protein
MKGEALAYNHLGICCYYEGDLKAAIDYHYKHSEMARDAGGRYMANCNLGICYTDTDDYQNAENAFKNSLEYALMLSKLLETKLYQYASGDIEAQSLVLDFLAKTATKRRDFAMAQTYLEKQVKVKLF